jgi:hypothetical protein
MTEMRPQDGKLRITVMVIVVLITMVAFGPFNPMLTGQSHLLPGDVSSETQSNVAFAMWLSLLMVSLIPGAMAQRVNINKIKPMILFISYTALTSLWSETPTQSILKAAALVVCSTAAARAAYILTLGEMFACLQIGLVVLVASSAVLESVREIT